MPLHRLYLSVPRTAATRQVRAPKGMPRVVKVKVGGQVKRLPVSYWQKDAISVGRYRHPVTGRRFRVTPGRIDRWVKKFRRMRAKGIEVPTPVDHSDAAEDNRGFVVGAERVGKTLRLTQQAIGEDAALLAARNRCSVLVDEFTDERGKDWGECIVHAAYTPKPVVSGHGAYLPFVASRAGGKRRKRVPVFFRASSSEPSEDRVMPLTPKQQKFIRRMLKLKDADKLKPAAALEAVVGLTAKQRAAFDKLGKAEPKAGDDDPDPADDPQDVVDDDDDPADLDDPEDVDDPDPADDPKDDPADDPADEPVVRRGKGSKSPAPIMASRIDPATATLLGRALATERKMAIRSGGISPDTAEAIDGLLLRKGRPNALALSAVAGSDDPLAFHLYSILRRNRPVPIHKDGRGRTGSQHGIALAREVPGSLSRKEEREIEREKKEARRYFREQAGTKK